MVNVITAKPQLEEFGGDVEVEYGNYNTFKVRGAVNIPIGEKIATRLRKMTTNKANIDSFFRRKRSHACRQKPGDFLFSAAALVSFIESLFIGRKSAGRQKHIGYLLVVVPKE